jgi:dolichol kinase
MGNFTIQKTRFFHSIFAGIAPAIPDLKEIKTEILRKTIHFLIALSPAMAAANRPATVLVLTAGVLGYTWMETLRLRGVKVPLISCVTGMASRSRDMGRFVMGPVTLGMGALLALLLYPAPAASIAIYALAFGDGFASLIGKLFGRLRPAFLCGKSIEGSLACFAAVLISVYHVSYDYRITLAAAVTATAVEALPLEDCDNLVIPVTVGMVVYIMSSF